MPQQPLSRDEFNALHQKAIESAHDGLSREQFNAFLDSQIEQAHQPVQANRSVGGFLGNTAYSGGRFLEDTAQGVAGLGKLAWRLSQAQHDPAELAKLREEFVGIVKHTPEIAQAMGGALKNRYGSVEAIKNTLYTDPVGVLSDISAIAMPAKGVLRLGGLTKAAKIVGTVGEVTNPLSAITSPAVRIAKYAGPRLQNTAVSAYERMLKPNKSTLEGMPGLGKSLEDRSRNVASALLNDPNGQISKGGVNRYQDKTSALLKQVDDVVEANPEARGSTQHLADAMKSGRGPFQKQWAPGGDTAAYDRVAEEVMSNPRITKSVRGPVEHVSSDALGRFSSETTADVIGRAPIPRIRAKTARDLTQGTYRNLGDKAYGELKGSQIEAQKAAARGGRAILNEALPEIEPLNKNISQRIDLGQVLDEAVLRSGKHDPVGLTQQVALSGVHPGMLVAALASRPGIGSPMARGLNQTGKTLSRVTPPVKLLQAALLARLAGADEE